MSKINQRIEACLRRCLPEFNALVSVDRLTGGASQETYRIEVSTSACNQLLALRRGKSNRSVVPGRSVPGLALEAKLMHCAKAVGVPEPEIIYILAPEDDMGEGFFMEWLEGISLGNQVLKAPELDEIRPQLARQCGEAIARIHAIDLDATGLRDALDVMEAEHVVKGTWSKCRSYAAEHSIEQPVLDYVARWLLENLPKNVTQTVVHNDYRNGNLMFSPSGIVAVLDWEFTHIGDPMRDLGWMCMNSWRYGRSELPAGGLGSYEEFFAGYESVSGTPVDVERVKFWEVFGSLSWAVGCLEMGDYYRRGVDKSVDRPGISRRSSEAQVDCINLLIPGPVELVQPTSAHSDNLPSVDELLESVVNYLRDDVVENTRGRTKFHARVARNSLGIVRRECELGDAARAQELARLQALFGSQDDLATLRQRLGRELRDGTMPLDKEGLAEHLRYTAVNQLAIDQPKYSGLANALAYGEA